MKLCKDCKHYRKFGWIFVGPTNLAMCAADVEPVRGEPKDFCDLSRESGPCGQEAKLFVARAGDGERP